MRAQWRELYANDEFSARTYPTVACLADRSGQRVSPMMSRIERSVRCEPGFRAALGVLLWVRSFGLFGSRDRTGGLGTAGDDRGAGGPTTRATTETPIARRPRVPASPAYMGKPMPTRRPTHRDSIASPDGSCPLPDTAQKRRVDCPSCAESHCSSALSSATRRWSTRAPSTTARRSARSRRWQRRGNGKPCAKIVQCCRTLLGTPLGLTCLGIQATSAQATCESLLIQAQAIGRCD